MKKILITGALGQIGTELTMELRKRYGDNNVVASSRSKRDSIILESGPFKVLDITDYKRLEEVVKEYKIDWIINLAAVLSAVGEKKPTVAWDVNMNGLFNVLEVGRENDCGVFNPSSIAAFGTSTPKDNTPQVTIQRPNTMYGVTKVSGELLCDYYYEKFGVDTRGVRFPGLISHEALPGGGTTDYAVHIYYQALKNESFTCPLDEDTYMDMMYMPDAINAIINLIEADGSKLKNRNAFNVTAMSFNPEMIYNEIKKHIPKFKMDYDIDGDLQKIANSWPNSLDDSSAKEEWNWKPQYDLSEMTKDMIEKLRKKLDIEK